MAGLDVRTYDLKFDEYDKLMDDLYEVNRSLSCKIRIENLKYKVGFIDRNHLHRECIKLRSDIRRNISKIEYLKSKKEELEKELQKELDDIYDKEYLDMVRSRDSGKVKYNFDHMCDICKKYWTISKWFVMTHKSVEHGIPIPHDYKGWTKNFYPTCG